MNVLLYVVDCLRADRPGILGYPRPTTPVLDRLAAEGIVFANAYAQSGWTAPSAASLFSSQYPAATGIRKMRDPLAPSIPWLPEILRSQGYRTAGFSTIYQVSALRGLHRGFHTFVDLFKDPEAMEACRRRGQDDRGSHYCLPLSEDLHRRALRWLDEEGPEDPFAEPFFMLLWSIDTHEPFRHPEGYNLDADPAYRGPVTGRGRPFSKVRNRADLRQLEALYDGALRYQDEQLGQLLDALEERSLLDETLVVVAGDHGEMFFEHGLAGHGKYPWEEELRVPLILRCPQTLPQGRVYSSMVQLMDVAPTILDVAGLEEEPAFKGRSLRPLFEDLQGEIHEEILLEVPSPFHREETARVARTRDWKYVEYRPPRGARRLKRLSRELGRALTLLGRPSMLPILYGHLLRGGGRELLSSLEDLKRFVQGRPLRRLIHLKEDPGEELNRVRDEPLRAQAMGERLKLLEATDAPASVSSSPVSAGEEAGIRRHLAQLGYLEE